MAIFRCRLPVSIFYYSGYSRAEILRFSILEQLLSPPWAHVAVHLEDLSQRHYKTRVVRFQNPSTLGAMVEWTAEMALFRLLLFSRATAILIALLNISYHEGHLIVLLRHLP